MAVGWQWHGVGWQWQNTIGDAKGVYTSLISSMSEGMPFDLYDLQLIAYDLQLIAPNAQALCGAP